MKLSYETCLNLDAIKKAGKAPLVDVLVEITKQFPIDEADYGKSTLLTKADWPALQRTVLWFEQTLGRDTLISVGPTQDDKKPVSIPTTEPLGYKRNTCLADSSKRFETAQNANDNTLGRVDCLRGASRPDGIAVPRLLRDEYHSCAIYRRCGPGTLPSAPFCRWQSQRQINSPGNSSV